MATIKDVARLAEVGLGTASRALSGKGAVSPDALERVRRAALALDFRPSRTARALASKSQGLIGVYVPTFEGTYFAPILQAVETELRAHDLHMVAASNFGRGSRRGKSLAGMRFLIERECDGILSVDGYMLDEDLAALRTQGRRLVLINRVVAGMEDDCFSVDHEQAGRLAARGLLAQGHRAVATMHSLRHSADVVARMRGFRAELALHGLAPTHEYVIDGLLTFANGWEQAGAIVAMARRPFTALFCANDVLAMAVLSRLQGCGLRVPQDLSVLGYDGAEMGAYTSPALSTVLVPSRQIATHACRHLLNLCCGKDLPVQCRFDAELLLRGSIAPGPAAASRIRTRTRSSPAPSPVHTLP